MIQVLLTSPTFAAFLFASLILAVTPGPGVMCTDTIYMLTASALAPAISRRGSSRPYGRYISAAAFIGLGVYAALASPRSAK
jgi:threonine/homoserine/homoserine lactone efflux protein